MIREGERTDRRMREMWRMLREIWDRRMDRRIRARREMAKRITDGGKVDRRIKGEGNR